VQLHGHECVPQDQLKTFRHVALPVERTLRVVPHVGALEEAADNLVQHEDADDRSVLHPADKEAFDPRLPQALHPVGEGHDIGRWRDPATMHLATRLIPRNHLSLVPASWLAHVDTFAYFESVVELRFRHVVPSHAKPL
jgi:hypothetical protein